MSFWTGTPGGFEKVSRLRPGQEGLYEQLLQAGMGGPQGGGSFQTAGDYYRSLLSNTSEDFNAMAAPELRRFREQIVPGLSEQFAGFGAGGLDSSGFRNAAVSAGTDLSERLGAIRAQLRQQGAQGLMNLGQQGLQQFDENIYRQGQPGALEGLMPVLGQLGGTALGSIFGPAGTAIGGAFGKKVGDWLKPRE